MRMLSQGFRVPGFFVLLHVLNPQVDLLQSVYSGKQEKKGKMRNVSSD